MSGEEARDLRERLAAVTTLLGAKDWDGACRACRSGLERYPGSGDLHHLLGMAEMQAGRPLEALAPLERAARLDPRHPGFLQGLARGLRALGRAEEAFRVGEQAWQLAMTRPPAPTPGHYLQARPINRVHFRKSKALDDLLALFLSSAHHAGDLARLYFLADNITRALRLGVAGDLAEFGVWHGHSARALKMLAPGRMLYLFESFSGFPPGRFAEDDRRRALFRDCDAAATRALVGADQVVWCEGIFPASIALAPPDLRLAVAHVDFGEAEATRAALAFAYPRLSPGGLLFVHDYAHDGWPGVAHAADAFLADKPERLVVAPDRGGTALLIKM